MNTSGVNRLLIANAASSTAARRTRAIETPRLLNEHVTTHRGDRDSLTDAARAVHGEAEHVLQEEGHLANDWRR